ncbi:hypothetical protein D3C74_189710 [compost metagenome]
MDAFNIHERNGTKPINKWLEQSIQDHAKNKYGLNVIVTVTKVIKCKPEDLENELEKKPEL